MKWHVQRRKARNQDLTSIMRAVLASETLDPPMTRIRIADSGNGIGTTTSVGNIALSGV